jgi:hypothetical protein
MDVIETVLVDWHIVKKGEIDTPATSNSSAIVRDIYERTVEL